jgi:hypothetical protein
VVNSSQGGGSKDTWVLAEEELPDADPADDDAGLPVLVSRALPLAPGPHTEDHQQ